MSKTVFQPGEYVTKGGKRARVYATDAGGVYPIHGAILDGVVWAVQSWTATGREHVGVDNNGLDLMPPTRVRWLNVYEAPHSEPFGNLYISRQTADRHGEGRIACIRIEYSEGQLDE